MATNTADDEERVLSTVAIGKIAEALGKYIDARSDPNLPRFIVTDQTAREYEVTKEDIEASPKLRRLAQLAITKQEMYCLAQGMNGVGVSMSIFRLKQKQHGYADKFEQDITSNGVTLQFVNNVPRPQDVAKKQRKS